MRILVLNAGSSSLKVGVFEDGAPRLKASFDGLGQGAARLSVDGAPANTAGVETLEAAVAAVPALLAGAGIGAPDAVGHRVAHGGDAFAQATRIDAEVIARIEALVPLAPLHNPPALAGIRLATQAFPEAPQVAVFDTAFHLSMPRRATTYAVPAAWRAAGLRRYGFHGTSHRYVAERAAEALGRPLAELRIVSLHLGNGASACAIARGASVDTSMGLTPLEGLVMGTRPGDLDPGAVGYVQRQLGLTLEQIEAALTRDSGLAGLTGTADMRAIEARAAEGDAEAQAAITVAAYRARKYLGAYAAAMGGLDAVVFTGGIGENSASMRRRVCDGLDFLGLRLDHDANDHLRLQGRDAPRIDAEGSRVAVIVTETAEALMIAREVEALLGKPAAAAAPRPIPVAVSGRHVHLTEAAVAALFGPGYRLTEGKPLRQPGNWAAEERVALHGPKGRLERVAILGPLRDRVQVEVSRTDSFALGIDAPVRDSGDLAGTPTVRLIGPAGHLDSDGLIVAARHIHITPDDAAAMGLTDGARVEVEVGAGDPDGRGLTFGGVKVRVSPKAATEMHIDTDEANAAGLEGTSEGELATNATAAPTGR